MKLLTWLILCACLFALGCERRGDQHEPETGSSRIALEMRNEAVQRETAAAQRKLADLQSKITEMTAAVESAAQSQQKALEDRNQLLAEVARLAESRNALAEQNRGTEKQAEELVRQMAELRRDLEAIQSRPSIASGSATLLSQSGRPTLPLTGKVEISTYGNASVNVPVGDVDVVVGEEAASTHRARRVVARRKSERATEIQELRQELKEYMREKAVPDGYRVIEFVERDPGLARTFRRVRVTGGYQPFYYPEVGAPQLYVELYVDRATQRAFYKSRAVSN